MNVKKFTSLLRQPSTLSSAEETNQLEEVLKAYPYFQAARALYLKGLKNGNSFKYNNALKIAAAYTADRDVLFDYITSDEFLQNDIANRISEMTTPAVELKTAAEDLSPEVPATKEETKSEDKALPQNVEVTDAIHNQDPIKEKEIIQPTEDHQTLTIGEPLPFTKKERHSFSEWLQLASFKTIERDDTFASGEDLEPISFPLGEKLQKSKKFELIDKFIANNPKIVPTKNAPKIDIKSSVTIDKNEVMTETLARVYVEQKKYKKALQAYKILSLKYPEKSGFFADRIKAVKKILKENK